MKSRSLVKQRACNALNIILALIIVKVIAVITMAHFVAEI